MKCSRRVVSMNIVRFAAVPRFGKHCNDPENDKSHSYDLCIR